jgi:2-polyprenyl-6-methoxyphenol hydroxylase-like FAD-dependent oxidoreductase
MCYEDGLRKNPNLEGRVEARFVIGRDGAVSNVRNGASDLPDSKVVSCVVGTYYGLSFPPPTDGIVTVSYPIFFSPSG